MRPQDTGGKRHSADGGSDRRSLKEVEEGVENIKHAHGVSNHALRYPLLLARWTVTVPEAPAAETKRFGRKAELRLLLTDADAVFIAEHETNACVSCAYRARVMGGSASPRRTPRSSDTTSGLARLSITRALSALASSMGERRATVQGGKANTAPQLTPEQVEEFKEVWAPHRARRRARARPQPSRALSRIHHARRRSRCSTRMGAERSTPRSSG